MPYSSTAGKHVIKTILSRLDTCVFRRAPIKALDIGCGSATYQKLINPLLASDIHWTGIEIWEPYIEQFNLREHYDELIVKPALTAVNELKENVLRFPMQQYNLIFVGDVLEHMPRAEALSILDSCKKLLSARGMLVVSVPIGEYPQGEYLGNPHEAHVDTWHTLQELYEALAPTDDLAAAKCVRDSEIGVGFYTTKHTLAAMAPKVAAYMISKDEEAFIDRCLASLEDADEIIVCDTGSTDNTLELIQLRAEDRDFHPAITLKQICISPWRFDDARNAALGYVPADIDLCVSIDADETLDEGFITRVKAAWWDSLWEGAPFTRLNHSFMTHWNWDRPEQPPNISKHYHERVHARFGYRWVHPVHEKLITASVEVWRWETTALMIQQPDNSKNRSSYALLLEQAVLEDPADWKLWSFLSNEHAQVNNIPRALEALDKCFALPDSDKVFIAWRRSTLYEHVNELRKAKQELEKAVELNPDLRETYVLLAELCERHPSALPGSSALNAWRSALQCTTPTQGYHRREELWAPSYDEFLRSKDKTNYEL